MAMGTEMVSYCITVLVEVKYSENCTEVNATRHKLCLVPVTITVSLRKPSNDNGNRNGARNRGFFNGNGNRNGNLYSLPCVLSTARF